MALSIDGKKEKKQFSESKKKVGLFEARVVAINPDAEEFKNILDIELKEDSKAAEYLTTTKDGNKRVNINFWLEDVNSKEKYKLAFALIEKTIESNDKLKAKYINDLGDTTWAESEDSLPAWFAKREFRKAYVGEEELYTFIKIWLSDANTDSDDTTFLMEWKKVIAGKISDLKSQIGGEHCINVGALATIETRENNGEVREYQTIYNKAFLYPSSLKQFNLVNYSDPIVIESIRAKAPKERKSHERFVLKVVDTKYGCEDFYSLKKIHDYNPEDNVPATNQVISNDGSDF